MKVSVAVPSRNYGRYLRACLESIRMQTHRDFEVLIADGGSSDDSRAIIDEFVSADSRFRLVSESDGGQPAAVSKAFAAASGDIHCYLNCDDVYLCADAFEAAVAAFTNYSSMALVSFTGWHIGENGRPIRPARLRYHPLDSHAWMRRRTAVVQPATFWRADITARFPFRTDMHYSFDSWFFYEAFLECSWMELSKPVAGVRLHPDNKSAQISAVRIRELAQFYGFKYGAESWRVWYLRLVALSVGIADAVPVIGNGLKKLIYLKVNSLAYLSFYGLPGI